mmetsp:Transcript_5503/g.9087  ORF Transcript_5503/g.9087 Transcript_5503/m.9087 type:complete len:164 (+) Transcript_5503:178-669(+)|eukprot:CAMPEP_0119013542 /NCGR_PEP_ID=MMETSP1176-20130426/8506_1 /TAXON_ID=265551 /ORGANISM="Synedropsis recta cf, Strain CCMP1620" /LENGTH=163 /DNA_ID=CAMNT_0006966639 /DNA_START=177 /DNA_END=668 /DNA_ORIENTATION=+
MAELDEEVAENEQYNAFQEAAVDEDDSDDDEDDILDMGGDDVVANDNEALLMRFCPHDSSMLYPQEDKHTRSLRYACRLCRYTEQSADGQSLIYRNVLKREVGNVLNNVPGSISDDPTLARSHNANCSNCGHHEAVFFQPSDARSDTLALIFVCCNCDHKWVN